MTRPIYFDVNIEPYAMPTVLHASQYETGVVLVPNFYQRNNKFELEQEGTQEVILRGSTNGENPVSFEYAKPYTGMNQIEFEVTEVMASGYGKAACEFVFRTTSGGSTNDICTQNFFIDFEKCPYSEEQFISDEEYRKAINAWIESNIDNIMKTGETVFTELLDDVTGTGILDAKFTFKGEEGIEINHKSTGKYDIKPVAGFDEFKTFFEEVG